MMTGSPINKTYCSVVLALLIWKTVWMRYTMYILNVTGITESSNDFVWDYV